MAPKCRRCLLGYSGHQQCPSAAPNSSTFLNDEREMFEAKQNPKGKGVIIKGSTTHVHKPPAESSSPSPLPPWRTGSKPYRHGPSCQLHPPGVDINKAHRRARDAAEEAYGKATTRDLNNTKRIERHLPSRYQEVLSVEKKTARPPANNAAILPQAYPFGKEEECKNVEIPLPPPRSSDFEEWKRRAEENRRRRDIQNTSESSIDQVQQNTLPGIAPENLQATGELQRQHSTYNENYEEEGHSGDSTDSIWDEEPNMSNDRTDFPSSCSNPPPEVAAEELHRLRAFEKKNKNREVYSLPEQ